MCLLVLDWYIFLPFQAVISFVSLENSAVKIIFANSSVNPTCNWILSSYHMVRFTFYKMEWKAEPVVSLVVHPRTSDSPSVIKNHLPASTVVLSQSQYLKTHPRKAVPVLICITAWYSEWCNELFIINKLHITACWFSCFSGTSWIQSKANITPFGSLISFFFFKARQWV